MTHAHDKNHSITLVFAAFISGLCSIIYELLIATTASYFLGDSVKFFSLTIGIYMASMGVGTLMSKYIEHRLLIRFVQIELILALLGGLSIPLLYLAYAYTDLFLVCYVFFTIVIGVLIGLEIPFLTRLMDRYVQLNVTIATILSFDYFGALIATMAFPFILLPLIGVYQSSLLFGFVNMSIGFAVLWIFHDEIGKRAPLLKKITVALTVLLGGMMLFSHYFLEHWDQSLYEDRIVFSDQSQYQRIILTKDRDDIRLYLDGNLQFSSIDEYRYHEALVHIPFAVRLMPMHRVLLLGAGDGLAVRELLRYEEIEEIIVVDLDEKMVHLGINNPYVTSLNQQSLHSKKVRIVNADAFGFLQENQQLFDLIIADLPDPNNNGLARLYSKQFYQLIKNNLGAGGMMVTQATSPYFAPQAYWSIAKTVQAAGFVHMYPYHAHVPSFGEWGFVLASQEKLKKEQPKLDVSTRYVDHANFAKFFVFDKDTLVSDVEVNQLDKPIVLDYYLSGWEYYR
ncbi:MAG: polyamine aminopropyltransferase [Alphaproteobacteria bacterium]|nr:MAG: polyamine aminopropyltransferase [Alphaproteobacteria bacterium]TAF13158.1 MAG: polyamine aminopropyltransferase [Alphaproteobacteria bacterium]TAF75781.1 MAG: polyamine aminopropyltransferase [Alphaproteobacteria bacterium]